MFNVLFNEVTVSLHHGLDPGLESPAGPGHGLPVEAAHYLSYLQDQGVCSVIRSLVDMPLSDAPQEIVKKVVVWQARRPELLPPELQEVILTSVLGLLDVVGGCPFMLEHIMASLLCPGP